MLLGFEVDVPVWFLGRPEGECKNRETEVALQPGSLGMEIDPESGLVKEVFDGAAKKAGVQAGWVFQTVAGKPYELLALKALLRGEEPFEATFGVLKPNPRALLKTSKGTIEVELFLDPFGIGIGIRNVASAIPQTCYVSVILSARNHSTCKKWSHVSFVITADPQSTASLRLLGLLFAFHCLAGHPMNQFLE